MRRFFGKTGCTVLSIWTALWILQPVFATADPAAAIYRHIGPSDAILVLDPKGRPVFSKNASRPLVPASTLKLATALAALELLGPDFRFHTDVYLSKAGDLILKGYGDPLLVSEVIADMAARVARQLPDPGSLKRIVVDDTFVDAGLSIPGRSRTLNPYDAPNGALAANFNTVSFEKAPGGSWRSAESQTPLIDFSLERIRRSGLASGRIVLSHDAGEAALYAGHLFRHFLSTHAVAVPRTVVRGSVHPEKDTPLLRYESPYPLTAVVKRLLSHSNNFIANQLLLTMGAAKKGEPATLIKGVQTMRAFLDGLLGPGRVQLAEGSGLSRENRISAQDLCRCLAALTPYQHLLPRQGPQLYKTGTLNGIRTRAGFIEGKDGRLYRFAVMFNTPGKAPESILRSVMESIS